MAYFLKIPKSQMESLWKLREYCAAPSIIGQVRTAIKEYLSKKEMEIGTSIEDAAEAISKHRYEESQSETLPEMERQNR